ncbi:MAG: hutP [Firmicutes bacterium]|nr:hutP [Bacillota bacterium]
MFESLSIGKTALLLCISSESEEEKIRETSILNGYKVLKGRVGSMDSAKIFAAVETAAKKECLIREIYRDEHQLYHAVLEAYSSICRGQVGLGNILRTAGLTFSIVRGPRVLGDDSDGEWIAVALYGSMGAPKRGYEHEVMGLGINPI